MKVVAEFAMRGRSQALMVSVGSVVLPGFSWLGSAVIGLITLRRGGTEGSYLLLWAMLPALFWLVAASEPVPFVLLSGTTMLAVVLRMTVSWPWTLIAAVGLSVPTVWIFELTSREMLEQFVALLIELAERSNQGLAIADDPIWLERLLVGFIAAGQLGVMIGTLALARWWQSQLYNPGGFGQEFRSLRLTPAMTVGLVIGMLACYLSGNPYFSSWILIFAVPFVFYGIALAHWMVAARHLATSWLVVFYFLLLIFPQYLMPLLVIIAVIDSLIDLRGRQVGSD